jgi:hypothetical protein
MITSPNHEKLLAIIAEKHGLEQFDKYTRAEIDTLLDMIEAAIRTHDSALWYHKHELVRLNHLWSSCLKQAEVAA